MNSKHPIDGVRRLWKASYQQIGLALVAMGGLFAVLLLYLKLNALNLLGLCTLTLGALLLVLRRRRNEPSAAQPRTALGRWLREVHHVWSASHWDLGLIAVAGTGVWTISSYLIETFAPSLKGSISLTILAAVPLAWTYGAAHLLAHHNAESGTSTPIINAIRPASFRFGTVVLGVLLYVALIHAIGLYDLLEIPDAMLPPLTIAGGLVSGALLPYVSILMVEHKHPLEALKRNVDLVAGYWGLLLACLIFIWLAFAYVAVLREVIFISAVYVARVLGPLFTDPAITDVVTISLKSFTVIATVLLVFYSLPIFVVGPVATYRMLVKEKAQQAPQPDGAEAAEATGIA